MKMNCYCVYDIKSVTYHPPFYAATDGAAIRMFSDVARDNNTAIGRHPADYKLFCVGDFDDQTGLLKHIAPARHVVDAAGLVASQQPDMFNVEHLRQETR